MPTPASWLPSNSVLFATALCLMMVVGEVVAAGFPGLGNPLKLAFFCFLPVALWMMTDEQRRDARTSRELEARIVRLEEALRDAGRPEDGGSPVAPAPDRPQIGPSLRDAMAP